MTVVPLPSPPCADRSTLHISAAYSRVSARLGLRISPRLLKTAHHSKNTTFENPPATQHSQARKKKKRNGIPHSKGLRPLRPERHPNRVSSSPQASHFYFPFPPAP